MSPWNLKNETTRMTPFMHPQLGFRKGGGQPGMTKKEFKKLGQKKKKKLKLTRGEIIEIGI
jgi:hypothetical protein